MTVKTIKFTDLPPYYTGNKAGICIIDDVYPALPDAMLYNEDGTVTVVDLKTVEMMSNTQMEEVIAVYGFSHKQSTEFTGRMGIRNHDGEIIEFSPNMIHTMDAVAIDHMVNTGHQRKGNPVPEWWNQKQEYTADHFKRAKAVHKRQLNKANRKRARHGR